MLSLAVLLAGCGSSTTPGTPASIPTATLSTQTYALDQLSAAPDDGSGARLLYAVIRVTTASRSFTAREAAFTLVDVSGRRYGPVPPSVYVPLDHLDGLTVAPAHTGAGLVAFPVPTAAPRWIVVRDGPTAGVLRAP